MLYANLKIVQKIYNREDFQFTKKANANKSVIDFVDFGEKFYIGKSMSSDKELRKLQTYYI